MSFRTAAVSLVMAGIALGLTDASAQGRTKGAARVDTASLEKLILDSPGPVGCYTNNTGDRLLDCEQREKGIAAFRKLYEADRKRAISAIQRRFEEIPSPKGGYFPILAAVLVKDKAFIPSLEKLASSQKENALGIYATEAIRVIQTGKCSENPPPSRLRELCL